MAIALSIVGIAFTAFCIWLTVRILNRREGWAKRFAIKLAILLVYCYLLGVGPAFYAMSCGWLPDWASRGLAYVYTPLVRVCGVIRPLGKLLDWYVGTWLS
jgi:hypothetical protein